MQEARIYESDGTTELKQQVVSMSNHNKAVQGDVRGVHPFYLKKLSFKIINMNLRKFLVIYMHMYIYVHYKCILYIIYEYFYKNRYFRYTNIC